MVGRHAVEDIRYKNKTKIKSNDMQSIYRYFKERNVKYNDNKPHRCIWNPFQG